MSLGEKKKHTGIVKKQRIGKGSKFEHDAVVLDRGDGAPIKMRILGHRSFGDPVLDKFVGMRVVVDGIEGSGVYQLFIENAADITVLGPPGRTSRPSAPKR